MSKELELQQDGESHIRALEILILSNKNDLIEDTFCYKLFEECVFDEILYFELINSIEMYLDSHQVLNKKKDIEIYGTISWIICNIYNCIIAHNDANDLYHIKYFDMNLWKHSYSDKLSDLTKRAMIRIENINLFGAHNASVVLYE